jgi:lysophospholipase L1-like esterase
MPRFKLVLTLLTLTLAFSSLFARDAAKYSTYYNQRASLFESLPHAQDDIVFLGDSITDGGEWCELFGDSRMKNRGISGDVTWGVLDRLEEVTAGKPAKIFLMIGVNDLARGKSVQEISANHREIVEGILQASPETQLYLQSVLPVNNVFGKFNNHTDKGVEILVVNKKLKELAKATPNTEYIDLFQAFRTNDGLLETLYSNDGLHLTGDGYVLWKSMIEKHVN